MREPSVLTFRPVNLLAGLVDLAPQGPSLVWRHAPPAFFRRPLIFSRIAPWLRRIGVIPAATALILWLPVLSLRLSLVLAEQPELDRMPLELAAITVT
jgi:hypothetical protein